MEGWKFEVVVGMDGLVRFQCDRCDQWHLLSEVFLTDEDGNQLPIRYSDAEG